MRVAIALGVRPCSTNVTAMALNTTDSRVVGRRSVSSRNAMSPSERVPRISLHRSKPLTVMVEGVLQAISVRIGFLMTGCSSGREDHVVCEFYRTGCEFALE